MTQPILLSLPVTGPYALLDTLRLQRFGRSDPTVAVERTAQEERYAKCSRTPAGPVTMVAWAVTGTVAAGGGDIHVALYGPGSGWVLPRLRAVLGLDDVVDFAPTHPRIAGWRTAFRATRLVHALSLPELHAILILQQRITFAEAARSWRSMVELCGQPAPGPLALMVPPGPDEWAGLRQPRARALGIDARRWTALQHAARVAAEVQAHADDRAGLSAITERLPGTGPWTTGLLLGLGAADPDAIVLGDVHLPHDVSSLLTDVPHGSDDKMLELLEPFRPHRFRVVRVMMGGGRRRL